MRFSMDSVARPNRTLRFGLFLLLGLLRFHQPLDLFYELFDLFSVLLADNLLVELLPAVFYFGFHSEPPHDGKCGWTLSWMLPRVPGLRAFL
jgi:hypothetical protein